MLPQQAGAIAVQLPIRDRRVCVYNIWTHIAQAKTGYHC